MNSDRVIIAEGRTVYLFALVSLPVLLILAVSVDLLGNGKLSEGIYYKAFGPIIYLIFYGGLSYAIFEFSRAFINRRSFIYILEDRLFVEGHGSIRLQDVSEISIDRGLIFDKLVIASRNRGKINVKSLSIEDQLPSVVKKLKSIIEI